MNYNSYFDPLLQSLKVQNTSDCFVKSSLRLHDVLVPDGIVRINGNADLKPRMLNSGIFLGVFEILEGSAIRQNCDCCLGYRMLSVVQQLDEAVSIQSGLTRKL